MKNVDYEQLKKLVTEVAAEAGVMGPSAPVAADLFDTHANKWTHKGKIGQPTKGK